MAELDELKVKITADTSSLKKGLESANASVDSASTSMKSRLTGLGGSFLDLSSKISRFALVAGGALSVVFLKSVIDTGAEMESFKIRLKALFGSAEEAGKAFKVMESFAKTVPFALQDIQRGGADLAPIAMDAQHLGEMLRVTGNAAAVTGLDFVTTSGQIKRALTTGIASAELFRQAGLKEILGFAKEAEPTLEEFSLALMTAFGSGGKYGQVTDELKDTFTGTTSMLQDKFTTFKKHVSEDFLGSIKSAFKDANSNLEENDQKLKEAGKNIGTALGDAVLFLADNFDTVITVIKSFILIILGGAFARGILSIAKLALALIELSKGIAAVKAASLWFAGPAGRIAIGALTALGTGLAIYYGTKKNVKGGDIGRTSMKDIDAIEDATELATKTAKEATKKAQAELNKQKKLKETVKEVSDRVELKDTFVSQFREQKDEIGKISEELNQIFDNSANSISSAFADSITHGTNFKESMVSIFQNITNQVIKLIFQLQVIDPLLEKIRNSIGASALGVRLSDLQTTDAGDAAVTGKKLVKEITGSMATKYIGDNLKEIGKNLFPSIFPRAKGGNVNPNMPYMVGERGPEMFRPKSAGTIIPNSKLNNSGITINQSLNFAVGVTDTVRAEIFNLLPVIQQSTVSAVRNERNRGGSFAKEFA